MADRKKTKLSLKRKTISNKSSLFNSIGQRQESLQSDVNDKDPETVIVNLSSDSEPDADSFYQNFQPSKRTRFSEEPLPSGDHGHKAKPIQLKPERLPSETSKPSKFLDVDDDLRKLRMMFLKMQKPRVDIRTLSDLPVTNTQVLCNVQAPESVKHHADQESKELSQESKELSPLPPMCKWCLRRKPADYSNLFTDIIQQELQASMADRSVGEHQRALQPPVKGDNSSHTGSMEKGWKCVQIGSTSDVKVEVSLHARKIYSKNEKISFPKSNNPTLTVERQEQEKEIQSVLSQKCYMPQENKISSFGKQTENENMLDIVKIQTDKVKIHPGNTLTQPGNIKTQSGNTVTQLGNIKMQPGNTVTQLGNIKTQSGNIYARTHTIKKTQKGEHSSPSPYRKVVESVERTNSNKQDAVTMGDNICPTPRQMNRKNTTNSLQPLVTVQTFPPTNSVSCEPKHTDSTENKPAFQGTGNLDTGKSEAPKQELESRDVQCCPLCQIAFDKSATQMDIDGHIAVCLSISGDDVTW